jgi:hypothetical protein
MSLPRFTPIVIISIQLNTTSHVRESLLKREQEKKKKKLFFL